MCAIEKITSATKKIRIAGPGGEDDDIIEVPIWNGTVANLTLMALGSSAPEILLAIIGVVGNNFEADKLGPGTIVGSAAFNLLAISAVCIVGIPDGETRRIKNFTVFCVTAVFSIFAYIWLLIVLVYVSENLIEVWEAALTFLFFPILVLVAYAADKGWLNVLFCQSPAAAADKQRQIELGNFRSGESEGMLESQDYFQDGKVNKTALVSFIREIKKNTKLSDEDAAVIAASKVVDSQPKSRIWYRIGATRDMTGGRRIQPGSRMSTKLREGLGGLTSKLSEDGVLKVYEAINEHEELPNIVYPDSDEEKSIVEFHACKFNHFL
ncbi:sodium/calcium exchanger 1 isoform X2 [Eurytemora carolleeae]|uniref:sodium/calcium exchanger 1 isoform X2 n=1 Tax=Eurytemora carolleeae TaxID=1294199 RepID=UPI000C77F812|nr:sodium/calcium exchanger 1 isoform X2 [Eurytemora carolleeae]|eukprot:XP_023323081.1 sodium/calcium exchanger 1-like isoform X2 [Eurytemora affinis]